MNEWMNEWMIEAKLKIWLPLKIFASRIAAEPAFVINVFPPSSCGSSIPESMLAFVPFPDLNGRYGRSYGPNTVRKMADLSSFSIDNNWFQRPWSQSRLGLSVGYPHEPLGHPQYPSVTQSLLVILESFRIHFHVTMNSIIMFCLNNLICFHYICVHQSYWLMSHFEVININIP